MPKAKRAPRPRTMPYPQPTLRGGEMAILVVLPMWSSGESTVVGDPLCRLGLREVSQDGKKVDISLSLQAGESEMKNLALSRRDSDRSKVKMSEFAHEVDSTLSVK